MKSPLWRSGFQITKPPFLATLRLRWAIEVIRVYKQAVQSGQCARLPPEPTSPHLDRGGWSTQPRRRRNRKKR